ncbi:hypothetical protein EBZ38_14175 [bacterium]|nr:hypothetical protein [bacterium]
MSLNKYFEELNEFANNNYHSFDGDFDSFDDEDFGFDDDYGYADGSAPSSAPTSQPYIINVQNTTASAINNVTILGAYSFIGTSAPAYGNTAGISISMGIANVTYTEFLYQSMNKPFSVGLTYTSSATANQVLETITVTQKDINGNITSKVLTPTIDPYQFQTDKIAFKFEYRIDGFTYLTISSILASATMKIYFYPSETVSVSRALAGRQAVQDYGRPPVVQGTKINIAAPKRRMGGGQRRLGR